MTDANGHGGSALASDLDDAKRRLRVEAALRRQSCDPAAGTRLADHLLGSGIIPPGVTVAGFWPMRNEIDIRPALQRLHDRGQPLALPRTTPRGHALTFHGWMPGDDLLPGPFGTMHPDGPPVRPAILLAPLLAFDATGARLGYGGGYYDRTLAALPGAIAVGCAYASQQVARVPAGPHDARLNAIVTENGVIVA